MGRDVVGAARDERSCLNVGGVGVVVSGWGCVCDERWISVRGILWVVGVDVYCVGGDVRVAVLR